MTVVLEDDAPVLVLQRYLQTGTTAILYVNPIGNLRTIGLHIPVLHDAIVGNIRLRTCIQVNLAGNTRKAPEVLVFEVGTVTPAHHLHGNEVLAFLQILRDVKLSSDLRIF